MIAEPIVSEIDSVFNSERDGAVTYHLDDSSINSYVSLELALHLMHANKEAPWTCVGCHCFNRHGENSA
ncbi:hypothetical protein BASA83_004943 [Batrachochytrium salamandrivorans]|nr:hypothetical protein BASA83_004943 [Batrachochytrium salamandrivorans]